MMKSAEIKRLQQSFERIEECESEKQFERSLDISISDEKEEKEEISFEVGEMVQVYDEISSKWEAGLIRNSSGEGYCDIQTGYYTFWNASKERIRFLSNKKLEEKLTEINETRRNCE